MFTVRIRKVAAIVVLTIVFLFQLYVAARSATETVPVVFRHAPVYTFPPKLIEQVDWIRDHVPARNSGRINTIVYVEQPLDAWGFGLYRRAFLPDLHLIPLDDPAKIRSVARQVDARHMLILGPLPTEMPLRNPVLLPPYEGGKQAYFGEIEP